MRQMGGLKRYLPVTYRTFLVGTIAIAGIPPLAGFFSKDEILAGVFGDHQYVLWGIGLFTAGLTATYMFRCVYLTFDGEFRGTSEQRNHLHESPALMTLPLIVLAAGSAFVGLIGIPAGMTFNKFDPNLFHHFMEPVIAHLPDAGEHGHLSLLTEWLLILISVTVAGLGILLATRFYGGGRGLTEGERWAARLPALHKLLANKYWVDELYDATIVKGTWGLARGLFRFDAGVIDGLFVMGARHITVATALLSGFVDKYLVDGLVNFLGWILNRLSALFRRLQTGLVSQYALVLVVGVFALVCAVLVLQ
jgi:NADH-quinone oxidoreductase subunit L